ncbi:expansin EXLX1 family cellulose-binding protein [Flavivirga aquatica]|nr:expansin EXLX1 family cellulose-binding protein [Flavivirga aquatica]
MIDKVNVILVFSVIFSGLYAQECNDEIHLGEGTFYGGVSGSSGGNCGLPVAADDFLNCALNTFDYDGSQACGACIEVTSSINKSVILKVVDRCPECDEGDVDIHQDAFKLIEDPIKGRIPISWKFVPCPLKNNDKSILINFKSGSSQYWTAIQFRNIKYAIKKLEYKQASGNWKTIDRVLFNFFIEPSGIASPMNLRATSVLGEELVFTNVSINLNEDIQTNQQFSNNCKTALDINNSFEAKKKAVNVEILEDKIYIKSPFSNWKIYGIYGTQMASGNKEEDISIQFLPKGIYLLVIDGVKAVKFLKS